ncbi:hypothetical protein V8C37DRAFT_277626 [Trichoderma ceciliae]
MGGKVVLINSSSRGVSRSLRFSRSGRRYKWRRIALIRPCFCIPTSNIITHINGMRYASYFDTRKKDRWSFSLFFSLFSPSFSLLPPSFFPLFFFATALAFLAAWEVYIIHTWGNFGTVSYSGADLNICWIGWEVIIEKSFHNWVLWVIGGCESCFPPPLERVNYVSWIGLDFISAKGVKYSGTEYQVICLYTLLTML